MKKIKSIILISTLCLMTIFCFTGCGEQETSSDGSTSTTKDTENTTTIQPTTEATTEAPTTKATTETQTTEKNNNVHALIYESKQNAITYPNISSTPASNSSMVSMELIMPLK